MMIFSLHNQTHTTQYLRPISGFLRSVTPFCQAIRGMLTLFSISEQGRKPSGIIWTDSLFGLDNGRYAPANNVPADDDNARKRCRSHSERFHT